MDRWVEAADWIVWQLCGAYVRNACTAGYKGILQDGALPVARTSSPRSTPASRDFVERQARRTRSASSATRAGGLTARGGRVDRAARGHRGRRRQRRRPRHRARPRRPSSPGQMVAIMGTSTCHVMNGDALARGARACAASSTAGSSPGLWGYEAGQSGVGDIFGWFVEHRRARRATREAAAAAGRRVHEHLTELAAAQAVGEHGLVALDWHSGNRSVLVDHELSGRDRRPDPGHPARGRLPRAAGGHRVRHPHDRRGVRRRPASRSTEFVVAGGLLKNALLMQIYADVTDLPLSTDRLRRRARRSARRSTPPSPPAPTPTCAPPPQAMGRSTAASTSPIPQNAAAYDALYAEYLLLHDYFGRGANDVMHRLKARRRAVAAEIARAPDMTISPDVARRRRRACAPRSPPCTPS